MLANKKELGIARPTKRLDLIPRKRTTTLITRIIEKMTLFWRSPNIFLMPTESSPE